MIENKIWHEQLLHHTVDVMQRCHRHQLSLLIRRLQLHHQLTIAAEVALKSCRLHLAIGPNTSRSSDFSDEPHKRKLRILRSRSPNSKQPFWGIDGIKLRAYQFVRTPSVEGCSKGIFSTRITLEFIYRTLGNQ
jgi:hypothetical protein